MIRELDSWDLVERIHERCGDRCRNGEGDDKSMIDLLNNDPDKISDRFCEENSDALGFSCNDLTFNEMGIKSTNPDCIKVSMQVDRMCYLDFLFSLAGR